MSFEMLLAREAKRVPLDFDAKLHEVWPPRLARPELPDCPACGGDGMTSGARWLETTWYALDIPFENEALREAYCWHNKLTQDEVDHLLSKGRLPTWVPDESERGGRWEAIPRTAEEINAANSGNGGIEGFLSLIKHDALNRMICVRYRAEKLGIELYCPVCRGNGSIGTDEELKAVEEWEPPEPPEGEGWQLWETVTEGSPVSPVFESSRELARWLAGHAQGPAGPLSYFDWLRVIDEDAVAQDMHTGKLS